MSMRYIRSYTSFFDSPKWGMNLLLSFVAHLVPVVGWMVWTGWLGEVLKTRVQRPDAPLPDFDASKLGYYLRLGLWPSLVQLVIGLVAAMLLTPLFLVCLFGGVFGGAAIGGSGGLAVGILCISVGFLLLLCGTMASEIIVLPMNLRACQEQDFARSFDWQFIKKFTKTVRKELLLSGAFLLVSYLALTAAGMCLFIVGAYVASALYGFAYYDLTLQLYLLYLKRGGEPIPVQDPPPLGNSPAPQGAAPMTP